MAGTFAVVAYVGYNYERLVVKYGLVDPKEHRKRKQADLNPLPMELRDEYVVSPHPDQSSQEGTAGVHVTDQTSKFLISFANLLNNNYDQGLLQAKRRK